MSNNAIKTEQFLTIEDLMFRWQCSYASAYRAMHSTTLQATKPKKKLLAKLRNVERYEELMKIR